MNNEALQVDALDMQSAPYRKRIGFQGLVQRSSAGRA